MDYISPVKIRTRSMSTKINKEIDDAIMRAIAKVGIHVDKEELIKALEYDRDQYQRGFMAGPTEWEWTPVSRRLPELYEAKDLCDERTWLESDNVIICDARGNVFIGKYEDDKDGRTYWNADDGREYRDVLTWMPLPEPYKGDTEETR